MSHELVFLKLGGSLITEKTKTAVPRTEVIGRLAGEIAAALRAAPSIRLVLGHGSGSFGHVPAKKHNTRAGVQTEEQWAGFIEVWQQAQALNRIVMDALSAAGVPAMGFPPAASVMAKKGNLSSWDLLPLKSALHARLVPVVYGDVVFDTDIGGTILSTEDLFVYTAQHLSPARILLAGDEVGIYQDYVAKTDVIEEITPHTLPEGSLGGAAGADVTGGMAGKVSKMLDLVQRLPNIEVNIFSGLKAGNVQRAIRGERFGTILKA
jgi:isopentenyl phosphate kinase